MSEELETLSVTEVGKILGCKRSAVYQLIETKGLPAINVNLTGRKQYRIIKVDFLSWMRCQSKQNQKPVTTKRRSIADSLVKFV